MISKNQDWKEFYPDAIDNIQGHNCTLTCFVHVDHAQDQLTRWSITGIVMLLNNPLICWISKRQTTVESSTYGSELVAIRIAVELTMSMRYCLRMLGVNSEKRSLFEGDNMAVVLNIMIPSSMLKKKHLACKYHKIRETIAARIIDFGHIESGDNLVDIATKPLGTIADEKLLLMYLFRQCKAVTSQEV